MSGVERVKGIEPLAKIVSDRLRPGGLSSDLVRNGLERAHSAVDFAVGPALAQHTRGNPHSLKDPHARKLQLFDSPLENGTRVCIDSNRRGLTTPCLSTAPWEASSLRSRPHRGHSSANDGLELDDRLRECC